MIIVLPLLSTLSEDLPKCLKVHFVKQRLRGLRNLKVHFVKQWLTGLMDLILVNSEQVNNNN